MRHVLLATILAVGAGCQAMGDRMDGPGRRGGDDKYAADDKGSRKKPVGGILNQYPAESESKKPGESPKKDTSKILPDAARATSSRQDAVEPARVPPIGQDVLLIPKMVYIPYSAQTPTSSVRLTSTSSVITQPEEPARFTAPAAREPVLPLKQTGPDATLQLMELCKKMNDRLEALERKVGVAQPAVAPNSPPPVIVPNSPPAGPLSPNSLFRRPLFPHGESMQPCVPCAIVPVAITPN